MEILWLFIIEVSVNRRMKRMFRRLLGVLRIVLFMGGRNIILIRADSKKVILFSISKGMILKI